MRTLVLAAFLSVAAGPSLQAQDNGPGRKSKPDRSQQADTLLLHADSLALPVRDLTDLPRLRPEPGAKLRPPNARIHLHQSLQRQLRERRKRGGKQAGGHRNQR